MSALKDKLAVVIGGGTGIGWGSAEELAKAGCRVVIAGRRVDVLTNAVKSWTGPPLLSHHAVDVAEYKSVAKLFEDVHHDVGPIDIVVNAAGTNVPDRQVADTSPDDWRHVLTINATGAYHVLHAALPEMRRRGSGTIIQIGSTAGVRVGKLGGVAYSAAKFAMSALGTGAANEVAADGVRVTTIQPGEVNTPLLDKRANPPGADHRAKILQPEDVGRLVVFIAALPPRAHVPEVIIKPLSQEFV